MSKVDEAIVEMKAALEAMADKQAGLLDLYAVDLETPAKTVVFDTIQDYDRRHALLVNAIREAEALVGDGYPALPVRHIPATAYEDLQEQNRTIDAALTIFAPIVEATNLGLAPQPPESK